MSEIADLSERRWQKAAAPDELKPVDALRQAIREIEAGTIDADHLLICIGAVDGEGGVSTDWLQAGPLNLYGQLGLLERVKGLIVESVA